MKRTVCGTMLILLFFGMFHVLAWSPPTENHPGNSMWIEPSRITLTTTNPNHKIGYRFNVTVYTNITGGMGVFSYQIAIHYDRSQLKVVAGNVTGVAGVKSEFFEAHSMVSLAGPVFDTSFLGNGSALAYEGLEGTDIQNLPRMASLWWFTFEVVATPSPGQSLASSIDISTETSANNWVTDQNLGYNVLPKSGAYDCNYIFASGETPTMHDLTVYALNVQDNSSISNAEVKVEGPQTYYDVTDLNGKVIFHDNEAGMYTVSVSKIGYEPAFLRLEIDTSRDLALFLQPIGEQPPPEQPQMTFNNLTVMFLAILSLASIGSAAFFIILAPDRIRRRRRQKS
jgi:hypothetical protein